MSFDPATTTVLDLVAAHPAAEAVFRRYDAKAGCCILCEALFETLPALCARYGLDAEALAHDLSRAIDTETP
ncbi:hypothetical protein [Solidesulfovibrio carbinolicus]|uniref:DUF1858 domain-containing protein n=1 Tax=Solidesulfovibrio carbinolicus TaxID=296842 RepID=A0A4P6HQM2_9BACT|nr:hypothetical protein [Solidesulfovibrio carbinolicus]QAZ67538.1 hypothetical protein C3Y92_09995 [Solidesulfovibrio carbinolicus]